MISLVEFKLLFFTHNLYLSVNNNKIKNKKMAKAKSSSSNSMKVSFGNKKKGKLKKKYGPKQQKPKAYRGQGR